MSEEVKEKEVVEASEEATTKEAPEQEQPKGKTITPERTTTITFTLGVYTGYQHNNTMMNGMTITIEDISRQLTKMLEANNSKGIGFTIKPVKVVYAGTGLAEGENAFEISAIYNPAYEVDHNTWLNTVIQYANTLKNMYRQSTLTININSSDKNFIVYLKN